jgi:sugar/nucleoside kinase (ribokinase family)
MTTVADPTSRSEPRPELIGVGSSLVDLVLRVEDRFLESKVSGAKGGMQMVGADEIAGIIAAQKKEPARAAGGAASNTTVGAANLGIRASFLGVVGQDAHGDFYAETLAAHGCHGDLIRHRELPTGHVLSLVTPDAERTMRTCLGAAATLGPEHISGATFAGGRVAVLEGYTLFNPELARAVARHAKAAGCEVALDFASFEVVAANRGLLNELLDGQVDLVFANQDEAKAWHPDGPEAALADLAGRTKVAVVKLGKEGALIATPGGPTHRVAAEVAEAIDTTGAGDCWAAGFLAGYLRGLPLPSCGRLGALAGAAVVQVQGAQLPPERWLELRGYLDAWT